MEFKSWLESFQQGEFPWMDPNYVEPKPEPTKPSKDNISEEEIKNFYKSMSARNFEQYMRFLGFNTWGGKDKIYKQVLQQLRERDADKYKTQAQTVYKDLSAIKVNPKSLPVLLKQSEALITPSGWIEMKGRWMAKIPEKILAKIPKDYEPKNNYRYDKDKDWSSLVDKQIARLIDDTKKEEMVRCRLVGVRKDEMDLIQYVFDAGSTKAIVDAAMYATYKKFVPHFDEYLAINPYLKKIVAYDGDIVGMIACLSDKEVDYNSFKYH